MRVEIAFYFFMFLIKVLGLLRYQGVLPALYLVIAVGLYAAPVFPNEMGWSNGYFNMYSMFLLCGSCIYLAEKSLASRGASGFVVLLICFLFLTLTAKIQPNWKESHYAMLAMGIFLLFFFCRTLLSDSNGLRLLSNLTYSVYLFHNWLWEYILSWVQTIPMRPSAALALTLLALLVFCYLAHMTVERLGVKTGAIILRKYKSRAQPTVHP